MENRITSLTSKDLTRGRTDHFSRSFSRLFIVPQAYYILCLKKGYHPTINENFNNSCRISVIFGTNGMEVGLGPSDFVLDGDPAPCHQKGGGGPNFRPMSIVAKQLYV